MSVILILPRPDGVSSSIAQSIRSVITVSVHMAATLFTPVMLHEAARTTTTTSIAGTSFYSLSLRRQSKHGKVVPGCRPLRPTVRHLTRTARVRYAAACFV